MSVICFNFVGAGSCFVRKATCYMQLIHIQIYVDCDTRNIMYVAVVELFHVLIQGEECGIAKDVHRY